MANTKGVNIIADRKAKSTLVNQIEHLEKQLSQRLEQYKRQNNSEFPISLKRVDENEYDFINPNHYLQDDGRQTWEHMVDKWGLEKTALWCEMTAFKYEHRIGRKPGEDKKRETDKIEWYYNKAKELNELFEQNKKNSFFNK